jgi:hypothetical protein
VIADYVFPTGEFKMEERILPFYLYFSPDDTEIGAHLGQVLREHGLEISWEGDEMAQELGINIQRPKAEINLFAQRHAVWIYQWVSRGKSHTSELSAAGYG